MKRRTMFIRMVVSSLIRRRSRMLVAILAVGIGATILSGLISIYYDIPRQMGQEFRSYGANLLIVPSADGVVIEDDDIDSIRSLIPSGMLVGLAPYRYENVKINEQPFIAAGTDLEQVRKTSPYWFITGAWPEGREEILVGQEVAKTVKLSPGSPVTVAGSRDDGFSFSRQFTVTGIVQTGGTEEGFIFLSREDMASMTGVPSDATVVECSIAATGSDLEMIASSIGAAFPRFSARTVKKVAQSEATVLTKLQALVYLVTAVILVLIMICVSTTMMAVVAERRKEIGLKKALGATNREIGQDFFGESIFLGLVGGLIGVGCGFLFAHAVGMAVFTRAVVFQLWLVPVTLLISIAITVLASLLPLRSATGIDPAIVLKGE